MGSRDYVDVLKAPEPVIDGLGGFAKNNMLLSTRTALKQPIQPLFETRGAAMLKAALSDRNKHYTNKSINRRQETYTKQEMRGDLKPGQQVNNPMKSRKRSPRNNVIFTEPVVTKQYEYEQTFVETPTSNRHSPAERRELFGSQPKSKLLLLPKSNSSNYFYSGSPKTKPKLKSFGPQIDDDSEDDLIILDSSEDDFKKLVRVTKAKQNPIKRPHDSLEEAGHTNGDTEIGTHNENKVSVSQSRSVSGGLFSAPKVAKIMPYFEDPPLAKKESADSNGLRCNQVNKNDQCKQRRSRALSQKMHLPGRCGSMSIPKLEAGSNFESVNDNDHMVINNNPSRDVSELLSFKRIQLRNITTEGHPKDNVIHQSNNYQPSNGYFSWLTTFLSNQMSKLIF